VETTALKFAVTFFATSIVTTHVVDVPLHAPLHPPNVLLPSGMAVSVTTVPLGKLAEHVPGQSIPGGVDPTAPPPVPAIVTASPTTAGGANVAVTLRAAFIVTTHVVDVPEHAPLQPVNVPPAFGTAVSVTAVPPVKLSVHVPGQLMTPGAPVTVPGPVTVTPSGYVDAIALKLAVTLFAASIVTVQVVDEPLHAPDHPPNVLVPLGTAVSVTTVPA
jgi:hypothetical protein